jgi:hypothetical protein
MISWSGDQVHWIITLAETDAGTVRRLSQLGSVADFNGRLQQGWRT